MCFGEVRVVVSFLRRFLVFRFTGNLARYFTRDLSE